MKEDYYKTLGVSKDASDQDIRRAYRKLAKEYHPDINKEAGAEEKFKEVTEAYETLSDPNKKANYDRFGHAAPGGFGGGSYSTNFDGVDLSDIFSSFFGGTDFFGANRPRKGQDSLIRVRLTFEEAVFGTKKDFEFNTYDESGNVVNQSISVNVPKGVDTNDRLRVSGKGGPGINGGPPGDIYIDFIIDKHRYFNRDGDDILLEVPINITEAILGFEKEIPTIHGNVTLKVSSGVQNRDRQRLRNKGIHNHNGSKGDMFVIFKVITPKRLTREQKKIINSLSKTKLNDKEIDEFEKFTKKNN